MSLLLLAVISAIAGWSWFAFRFDPLGRAKHASDSGDERAALIAASESLLDRRPNDVLALKRTAVLLIDRNDWKRVREIAQRLIKIPGGEIAGWTLAGVGFHGSKHSDESIAAFERVLELDPDLEEMPLPRGLFWNYLAIELMAVGRADDARRHLERELASHDDAGLRALLGIAHEKLGNSEEAERCWKAALAIDPNNAGTYLDLGRLALARRRFDEAIPWLERAAELSPEAVDPVYNLGRVYRFKNDAAKARHYEALADARRRTQPPRGGMGAMPADIDESDTMSGRASKPPR